MFSQSDTEKKLQILRDLYEVGGDLERPGFDEPEIGEEIEAMREMKAVLDARPRQRPSAIALQSVLIAAADKSVSTGPRRDRAPVARRSAVYLRVGAVSAVVVVLLSVVTLLRQQGVTVVPPIDRTLAEHAAEEQGSGAPATDDSYAIESTASTPPPVPTGQQLAEHPTQNRAVLSSRRSVPESRESAPGQENLLTEQHDDPQLTVADAQERYSDMLAWDHSSEVIEVYQDIEMVGGGVDLGWEPPSVPLEVRPQTRPSRRAVQPAGQR